MLVKEKKPRVKEKKILELKQALQAFQSTRLNNTYKDLKKNPEYKKIGNFFFNKLYAPEDFSFRDASIKKLNKVLKGTVYKGILSAGKKVIELHELTDSLDDLMVKRMLDLGVGLDMNMEEYQKVYRSLDNYDQRIYQIKLSTEVVAISLRTVRGAAHLLGIGKIIDFIYEGYDGFRKIKNIDHFVETIEKRELAWHDKICSGGSSGA